MKIMCVKLVGSRSKCPFHVIIDFSLYIVNEIEIVYYFYMSILMLFVESD